MHAHRCFARVAFLVLALTTADAFARGYTVKPGDSLWALAKRFGVTVDALKRDNKLAGDDIRSGQVLELPSAQKSSAARARDRAPMRAAAASPPPAPRRDVTTPRPTRQSQERAAQLYAQHTARGAPQTASDPAPSWVLTPPSARTQGSKPPQARGGINPCAAPDPGFGAYQRWEQIAPMAHVLLPEKPRFEDGGFNVVFHFHGREPARKEWVTAMHDAVLVSVDVGIDSQSYANAFSDIRTVQQVLRAVEARVTERYAVPEAHISHLALSAWSAGYAAVERILATPFGQREVSAVVLLDGLHSGYTDHSLDSERLAPFVAFASQAAAGNKLLFVSHSSIRTPGYASTTETANYLIWRLGGKPREVVNAQRDPMGLERISSYSLGHFHVRGYSGSGALDHCAHLALLGDVLEVHLKPLWNPSGNENSKLPGPPTVAAR